MIKQLLGVVVLIGTTTSLYSHGWYGRDYDTHRYCRGYETRGVLAKMSRYGYPRRGGEIEGKKFYWYGTQAIWWNGNTPYVWHKKQWIPWSTAFPTLNAPKKRFKHFENRRSL